MTALTERDRHILSFFSEIIVAYSAGVDSTTCLLWALGTGKPVRAVMYDGGNEPPDTPAYLAYIAEKTGIPVETYCREGHTFTEIVQRRGMWPVPGKCLVSATGKRDDFRWYIDSTGTPQDALYILGQRRSESKRRSLLLDFEPLIRSGRSVYRPILDWSKGQCFAALGAAGIMAHPAYGHGRARVGCVWCVNSRLRDLVRDEELYPERCAELRALRASIGLPSIPPGVRQAELFEREVCRYDSVLCE